MKKLFVSFLLCFSTLVNAQVVTVPIPGAPGLNVTVGTGINALPLQNIQNNPNAVNITMGDDAWQGVALPYTFPYFGRNFTNSWMLSNGVVTFQDPTQNAWGMCCSGMNLSTLTDTRYNYSIFGLWTDLIAIQGGTHYYMHQADSTTFGWYSVSQFYNPAHRNSLEIKIDSTGLVDTRISGALVTGNWVTSGMTGDLSKGEHYQYYHGQGINISGSNAIQWSALSGTGSNICVSNPLFSPTCPGYIEAFLNQQCSISALYNPSCPGYQQAFFNQQCSLNSLYDQSCPGYQQAYFTQQCSIDALYSPSCPEYEQAFFNQQCSLNSLYNNQCPGYAQAYFSQQCSLNGLYDTQCPNYAEAFATRQALENSNRPTTVTVTNTNTNTSQTVAVVSDPIVNQTITTTATTTTPTNPAAAVTLTSPPQQTTQQAVQNANTQTNTKSETKTETKTSSSSSEQKQSAKSESKSDDKQKSAEVKQAAQEKAKEEMKKAETATTFEGQVAVQTNVIGAMSFVPGFSAYAQVNVPDVLARDLQRQYGKDVVDNRRLGRGLFGPSDLRHQEMVNQQYR